jgi:hypothetical protein
MNEWKGVLVFNKEMVKTCLAINACRRKKGRKEGGEGFVVVLRMWFTWSPMSQIDGCSPRAPHPQKQPNQSPSTSSGCYASHKKLE